MMMLSQWSRLKRVALDLVFPRWCVGCGQEGSFICPDCCSWLPQIEPPVCRRCGYPQTVDVDVCPECADWPSDLDSECALFRFEGVIRIAVHQLKYHNLKALSDELAGFMFAYLIANPLAIDVLVPVPIHPRRLRERGYNQSRLLANLLAKLTGWPLSESLVRNQPADSQTQASDVGQRWRNVRNAFRVPPDAFKDKRVLLIDDVVTSGATLNACATALKVNGAVSVRALTLAREI